MSRRIVDLTSPIDPRDLDLVPESMPDLALVVAPRMDYHTHDEWGRDFMVASFGCDPDDLPGREGPAGEVMHEISTHCGTHVDAPLHSGRMCEGRPSRTLSDIALEELYRPGMVLDVRAWAKPGEAIPVEALKQAIAATGRDVEPGDAVLIRTGQERYRLGEPEYFAYPGMSGAGTRYLTGLGATVLGTDAIGWDRPIPAMRRAFQETRDPGHIWDGHYAIQDKEAFIVQQLVNLGALPLSGFMVGFFPLKLTGTSAAPARVVAFVEG
ncbi:MULTISPECIES: cyclase family protein [Streptomyces]|uniref:cyclase family protein n=1 Tax=Streptomyces TaxID=1883 RepID=UPI00163C57EE|nr:MULTISPECIES: cyclase family protein [Streptomyces]MBC2876142.1 cyclase family protein [Streptomyces sp. TYQ1024]UBI38499.1 cyclase family protein [Streptomyces mobaraensis]UKW31083.1 cyclase family protein [Streptomyces sp. TYQ1024]